MLRVFGRARTAGATAAEASAPAEGKNPIVRTLASLQDRSYRWFWFGMVSAFFGMQMGQVARQWLVYELTGSGAYLGIVGAGFAIPTLLLSLLGGVVADRVHKKRLLVTTQAAVGMVAFMLATLILFGVVQPWHVVLLTFVTGTIQAFNMPGRMAMITELVPPERLTNAIALNSAGMNLAFIVAPSLAGILVGVVGLAFTYYLHVLMLAVAVGCLFMLPAGRPGKRDGSRNPTGDMKAGLAYLTWPENRPLSLLMLYAVVPIVFVLPYEALLPVFAKDVLHMGSEGLGFMLGSVGVGALAGSMTVAALGNVQHKGRWVLGATLLYGVAIIVFANSTTFWLSAVVLAFMGAVRMVFLALVSTVVQLWTTDEFRGRVTGVYNMTWGMMPLGALPAGFLADRVGAPAVLTIGGIITIAVTVLAAITPTLRRIE